MQFGKVDTSLLDDIDFQLPEDPEVTRSVIQTSGADKTTIYIGCAKWGRKDWVGTLYPKGTKDKDFLSHYVKHFGCVELNATHYRVFPLATVEKWRDIAGEDFRFCPKFTNSISHYKRLKGAHDDTMRFYEQIEAFEDKLGPSFLQLHDNFTPDSIDVVASYLLSLPKHIPVCLEVRNHQWFEEDNMKRLFDLCNENGVGLVSTDTAGRRDVMHTYLPVPIAFVRFVGNGLHSTDYTRIDDWVLKMKSWIDSGLREIYFFMHQHDELHSPELCKYLIEEMNKACGVKIKAPVFINDSQGSLF